MAELAIAAFGALATSGTAAAGATAGVSALSVLQGVATVASVLTGVTAAASGIQQGKMAAQEARFQSDLAGVNAKQEATASAQRADDLKRQALLRTAEARVAFGAAGLDISSRQLDTVEGALSNDLTFGLELERSNSRLAQLSTGLKQNQLSAQAANAISSSRAGAAVDLLEATGKGINGYLDIRNRGGPTPTGGTRGANGLKK